MTPAPIAPIAVGILRPVAAALAPAIVITSDSELRVRRLLSGYSVQSRTTAEALSSPIVYEKAWANEITPPPNQPSSPRTHIVRRSVLANRWNRNGTN